MIFRIKLHWWQSLLAAGLLLACAWLIAPHLTRAELFARPNGRFDSIGYAAAIGVAAGFACMIANFSIHQILGLTLGASYFKRFEAFALDVIREMRVADAVAGGVLAGVGEEPLFRGVILPAVGDLTHSVLGIVVAAVVFGFAHWLRREYFWFLLWGIGEGLAFGTLCVVTGTLVVPAIAHGLFDTVGFLYFERLRQLAGKA